MEAKNQKRFMLFSGSANPPLAQEVADLLGVELGGVERKTFANGEISIRFTQSVRGADCFVLQSHSDPINHHIMEQADHDGCPAAGVGQADHRSGPVLRIRPPGQEGHAREPITARLMADLFVTAGADRLVSVDLHSTQIQGFTTKPFDSLTALPIFTAHLGKLAGPLTVVSPDSGRVKLAARYARHLDADVAFVHKRRRVDEANKVAALEVVGDVEGRHCVIVDDMIDTAGTIVSAAELLKERGALTVRALATHPVLSPPAADRIKNSPLEEVLVTNTLPVPQDAADLPNLKVLSIAPLLADTLMAIFRDDSVSAIFMGENV